MIYLTKYKEFNPALDFPSIKKSLEEKPYEYKQDIIKYLKNGKCRSSSASIHHDIFTDEKVNYYNVSQTDGEYVWMDYLAYYVDKYNLRLPRDFEEKVLRIARNN